MNGIGILADYPSQRYIEAAGMGVTLEFLGRMLHSVLPGKRVIYTHSQIDTEHNETLHRYKLHILSLDDSTETEIIHPYEPVPITEEDLAEYNYRLEHSRDTREKERYQAMYDEIKEKIDNVPYKAAIQSLKTDGKYIFTFTYKKNNKQEILVDVFDADSRKYTSSFYLPSYSTQYGFRYLNVSIIKNGYLYRFGEDYFNQGFATIEVCRIDPTVYREIK